MTSLKKLSMVDNSSLGMTESKPTILFLHFQRTGSEVVDVDSKCLSIGGLLLDLHLQRTTNTTDNAQRRNFLILALALAQHSRCKHFFFLLLRLTGAHQQTNSPTSGTRRSKQALNIIPNNKYRMTGHISIRA